MLSKNKRPYDPEQLPPGRKRLAANLHHLASANQLSAGSVQELINDVSDSGIKGFKKRRTGHSGNTARNLMRSMVKRSQWPHLYWAKIRVMNLKTCVEEPQWMAFQLPHEFAEVLNRHGLKEVIMIHKQNSKNGNFAITSKNNNTK
jgi:hypothetical protein